MQRRSGGPVELLSDEIPAEADGWKDVRSVAHSARRSPLRFLLLAGFVFFGMFVLLAATLHGALPSAVPQSLRGGQAPGAALPAAPGVRAPATPAYAEKTAEAAPSARRREKAQVLPGSPARTPPDKPEVAQSAAQAAQFAGAVRGVAADMQSRYASHRDSGTFKCFDGSASFESFGVVNDDYCECSDGSDEPGTSACSGAHGAVQDRFSCGWATGADPTTVRLAAVNDGICDCCGGEDEWDGVTACAADLCAELKAAEAAEASKHLAGSRAREAFAAKTAKLAKKAKYRDFDGGPDGVFFAAAEEGCITQDDGDFEFELCLFDRVRQIDKKAGGSYKIGKGGAWSTFLWEDGKTHRKDYSKLIMGDGEYCPPAHAPRRAEISFECAESQSIVKVAEAAVCVYAITLRTPAACRPLVDHHDHH